MTEDCNSASQYWVKELSKVQLPVLSEVMKQLNAVTSNNDSSAAQLSEIILQDSSLTAKVLRIANSAYHNPNTDNTITTISRAVVQLGFQGIKAISLSVMLVDSLLKDDARQRVLAWMARAFHAAVQAEHLLLQSGGTEQKEEVFITALLLHLGEMAFWSSNCRQAESLDRQLEAGSNGNPQLETELLGTTMKHITRALAQEWQLGGQLQAALCDSDQPGRAIEAVWLADAISLVAEQGWDSEAMDEVLARVSLFTGLDQQEALQLVKASAEQAASVAVTYGANRICHLIPESSEKSLQSRQSPLRADPQLQLDILREMAAMVEQRVDVNTLFQIVVEGIQRGIGLERVALCLLDPKITTMQAKYVLGADSEEWRSAMVFAVKSDQDNLFAHSLHSRQLICLQPASPNPLKHLINSETRRLLNTNNCLIAPIFAGNRPIGIIVADRGWNGADIDPSQRDSFDHFVQQTSMSLAMLASQRRAAG